MIEKFYDKLIECGFIDPAKFPPVQDDKFYLLIVLVPISVLSFFGIEGSATKLIPEGDNKLQQDLFAKGVPSGYAMKIKYAMRLARSAAQKPNVH